MQTQAVVKLTCTDIGRLDSDTRTKVHTVIDWFGRASAEAQDLGSAVTSSRKFTGIPEPSLYLAADSRNSGRLRLLGGLKASRRRIFVYLPRKKTLAAVDRPCVLDFYVHETVQRLGVGAALFQTFLASETCEADHVAFDRPSSKLLVFLERKFGLHNARWQANNFVVFDALLDAAEEESVSRR